MAALKRVLVTGPESSGTSLVSRIFRSAGADVVHQSATYDDGTGSLIAKARTCDWIVVVVRDPYATSRSQRQACGLTPQAAAFKLGDGYYQIANLIARTMLPVVFITYEQLVLDVESIRPTLHALDLKQPDTLEPVRNENVKYGVIA